MLKFSFVVRKNLESLSEKLLALILPAAVRVHKKNLSAHRVFFFSSFLTKVFVSITFWRG